MKDTMKTRLLLSFFLFQQKLLDIANEVLLFKRLVLIRCTKQTVPIYKEILKVRKTIETHSDVNEVYQIVQAILSVKKIEGDIAEVGVYRGGTAKVIAQFKETKSLYLFDTFEGFPKTNTNDLPFFRKGMLFSQYKEVKSNFKNETNVMVYKGIFPQKTGKYVKDRKFSFVNLDVDLYESTVKCLRFFYPRMSRGGIIISHDYSAIPAVYKAFTEFFEDKPEIIIRMCGSQCLVVKV